MMLRRRRWRSFCKSKVDTSMGVYVVCGCCRSASTSRVSTLVHGTRQSARCQIYVQNVRALHGIGTAGVRARQAVKRKYLYTTYFVMQVNGPVVCLYKKPGGYDLCECVCASACACK
jgi:hypothetical protein